MKLLELGFFYLVIILIINLMIGLNIDLYLRNSVISAIFIIFLGLILNIWDYILKNLEEDNENRN